jgi:hypothetical protein
LDRRVAALLTTSPSHRRGRVHPGVRGRLARHLLRGRFELGVAGYRVFEAPRRTRSRRKGKVSWITVVDPRKVGDRALRSTLRNLLEPAA